VVPYLIAGHPGETSDSAGKAGNYLKSKNIKASSVQEFMPLPMTISASLYYTGEHPFTGEKVEICRKLGTIRDFKQKMLWWQK
jgi:radical SAM superfamily enzyme YgiQ (UPF0313 family)